MKSIFKNIRICENLIYHCLLGRKLSLDTATLCTSVFQSSFLGMRGSFRPYPYDEFCCVFLIICKIHSEEGEDTTNEIEETKSYRDPFMIYINHTYML